ncbi:MAG: GNAT family N-acetyltransferase [Desulfuromonadales bacterium]|jgi:CelD/BcsL family acetyltransferase involved in cellulose biosynthesis
MIPYSVVWDTDLTRLERGDAAAALLAASCGSPFTTVEWLCCAAAALPHTRTLHVLYVYCGEALVACLPLTRGGERVHHIPVTSLRLLGDPLADRVPLLVHPDHPDLLPFVLDRLFLAPFSWEVLILSELPENDFFRTTIERWRARRPAAIHWQQCSRAPVLPLSYGSASELRASYSKSLATRLRRSRNKLEKSGRIEFRRFLPAPEEIADLLPQLKRIEDLSWKGSAGVGIFSTPEKYEFFRDLSSRLAARKWLDIGLLLHDGQLISYRYGFRFRQTFFDYNLAFHPDWAPMAPGRVLLEEMIASSVDIGLRAIDASRSGLFHSHQLAEWTKEYIDHYQLWLFRPTLRSKALNLLRTKLRPTLKGLLGLT